MQRKGNFVGACSLTEAGIDQLVLMLFQSDGLVCSLTAGAVPVIAEHWNGLQRSSFGALAVIMPSSPVLHFMMQQAQ